MRQWNLIFLVCDFYYNNIYMVRNKQNPAVICLWKRWPADNSWYATTGPPQTLRRQAQRLSRAGGRMLRSGRSDDDVAVVAGGIVGWSMKVTCRGRPRGCCGGGGQVALVMSNQRFLKIVCFRFPTNVPLKIEYIRFWNKIHYRTKTFSFRSKNFWII